MSNRATSLKAFREMISSGDLRGKQAAALEAVIMYGPATSGEIIAGAALGTNVNLWRARFTELLGRGLIREVGTRACKTTGRHGLVWEFTGRTKPLELERGRKITETVRKRVRSAMGAPGLSCSDAEVEQVIQAARAR